MDDIIEKDENLKKGLDEYNKIEKQANEIAEDISSKLIEDIVKDNTKFNLSTAMMTVSKCFGHLASYLYDNETDFLTDVKKARECVVSELFPRLLDAKPCGDCPSCKNGHPEECQNLQIRADYTESRFIPLICEMMLEYDMFNKVLYLYSKEGDSTEK